MRIAAVLYEGSEGQTADEIMTELANGLRKHGLRLTGAVQSNVAVANRSRCDIVLEDLTTGRMIRASQDRGASASGCRLDTEALEESVGLAASSLSDETDFVIVNRFGRQEADGDGFRAVIEQAVLLDIPVLVGLNRAHLDSWREFVGKDAQFLPLDLAALKVWCASNVSACVGEAARALG